MKLDILEIVSYVEGDLRDQNPVNKVINSISTDTRKIQKGDLFIPLIGEHFNGHSFIKKAEEQGAEAALWQEDQPIDDDINIPLIIVQDTLLALQTLAKKYKEKINPTVVAITGSNGKTTTKDLVYSILQTTYKVHKTEGNLNNHIGVPLTLLSMPYDTQIAVVEMGMSNLGEIEVLSKIAEPDIALITNIGESHLEYLKTRENIAKAKLEILEGLKLDGILILNGDEPLLRERLEKENNYKIRWIGTSNKNTIYPNYIKQENAEINFITNEGLNFELPLLGVHNVINSLMAVEVGKLLGISISNIQKGLQTPKLTGMRLQQMQGKNGALILNDAYNASPTSMKAALSLLTTLKKEKKVAVLGDMLELGQQAEQYHYEIGRYCSESKIDLLIATGRLGQWIAKGALETGMDKERVKYIEDIEQISTLLLQGTDYETVILIKGSRGVRLEAVVNQLI